MRVRCGAICLIALFVALPDQESNYYERGAKMWSGRKGAPVPYRFIQILVCRVYSLMTEPVTTEEQITPGRLTNIRRRNGHLIQGSVNEFNKESFKEIR